MSSIVIFFRLLVLRIFCSGQVRIDWFIGFEPGLSIVSRQLFIWELYFT